MIKRICVFCGSAPGTKPIYMQFANRVGRLLAEKKIELVYGGGNVGLMGAVADGALSVGGVVQGVMPASLCEKEIAHPDLSHFTVVGSMHERKSQMAELSDAFLVLPGGFGTFEEMFEAITWSQLGIHRKACGLLNVESYWDKLLQFCDHAVNEGFIRPVDRQLILFDDDPEALIDLLCRYQVPESTKWLKASES